MIPVINGVSGANRTMYTCSTSGCVSIDEICRLFDERANALHRFPELRNFCKLLDIFDIPNYGCHIICELQYLLVVLFLLIKSLNINSSDAESLMQKWDYLIKGIDGRKNGFGGWMQL
jgi:hypothetical protein